MWRTPSAVTGALLVTAALLLALAAIGWGPSQRSILMRLSLAADPTAVDREALPLAAPDARHALGTDILGRDVLSRLLHGARVSVVVGVTAEAIALSLGILVGACAGYAGGRIDALLMRVTDILLAFPVPLIAMGAMAVFDTPSLTLVFLLLGFMGWGEIARLIRAEFLSLRERPFTEAARTLGARGGRIAFLHLLPNSLAPALVAATVGVAGNILTEAWLSFLGLGAQPPTPSWGGMIFDGRSFLTTDPRLCILPGLMLAATVAGFLLLADGLRAALDPRSAARSWAL